MPKVSTKTNNCSNVGEHKRLYLLYQDKPVYSHVENYYSLSDQIYILKQSLQKILKGNPLYYNINSKGIDNLLGLCSSTLLIDNAEHNCLDKTKRYLEILYVLLTDVHLDLTVTVDCIKNNIVSNQLLWKDDRCPVNKIQCVELMGKLISELLSLRTQYYQQQKTCLKGLSIYYSNPLYYEDMVHSKQVKIQNKVSVNSRKFKEIKWQIFALLNKLAYLFEYKLLYDIETQDWFLFWRFFVRERYSPVLQPCLFSSIKKNLEALLFFLEFNCFDTHRVKLIVKAIVEADYKFYTYIRFRRNQFMSGAEKNNFIDSYIKKVDMSIRLSINELYLEIKNINNEHPLGCMQNNSSFLTEKVHQTEVKVLAVETISARSQNLRYLNKEMRQTQRELTDVPFKVKEELNFLNFVFAQDSQVAANLLHKKWDKFLAALCIDMTPTKNNSFDYRFTINDGQSKAFILKGVLDFLSKLHIAQHVTAEKFLDYLFIRNNFYGQPSYSLSELILFLLETDLVQSYASLLNKLINNVELKADIFQKIAYLTPETNNDEQWMSTFLQQLYTILVDMNISCRNYQCQIAFRPQDKNKQRHIESVKSALLVRGNNLLILLQVVGQIFPETAPWKKRLMYRFFNTDQLMQKIKYMMNELKSNMEKIEDIDQFVPEFQSTSVNLTC